MAPRLPTNRAAPRFPAFAVEPVHVGFDGGLRMPPSCSYQQSSSGFGSPNGWPLASKTRYRTLAILRPGSPRSSCRPIASDNPRLLAVRLGRVPSRSDEMLACG